MTQSRVDILRKLETAGYLSLNQFVKYLQEFHPPASVSYPTARKLCSEGKIKATKFGSSWRIGRAEVERWVAEGNYERISFSGPYPRDPGNYR